MASKRTIETRGVDVQAAIDAGLKELDLTRRDVIVEVLDEGSRGLLGIGGREAVVRLTPMVVRTSQAPRDYSETEAPRAESEAGPTVGKKSELETAVSEESTSEPPPSESRPEPAPAEAAAAIDESEDWDARQSEDAEVATQIVKELVEHLNFNATVTTSLSEPDDVTGRQMTIVDVDGDEDMGILIGPRGETLGNIQYICRLMAGHKLHRRVDFAIDVQGYRQRREQALTRLAERMAQKVIKRERPISLEPMPPHERRIIHVALRDHDDVYTNSVGEGKRRKVRIYPTKNGDNGG